MTSSFALKLKMYWYLLCIIELRGLRWVVQSKARNASTGTNCASFHGVEVGIDFTSPNSHSCIARCEYSVTCAWPRSVICHRSRFSDLHQFFEDKDTKVHEFSADADSPIFTSAPFGCELHIFAPITVTEVDLVAVGRSFIGRHIQLCQNPCWHIHERWHRDAEVLVPFLCWLSLVSKLFE